MKEPNQRSKQKLLSRAKILKAATELFGKQGIQNTGIDQIMKKAGLTAGAFYAHFKSKDDLIEEVVWSSLPIYRPVPLNQFLEKYLSPAHRDHPEKGCPLGALGSDLGRARKQLKKRIASRLSELIDENARLGTPVARKEAISILSTAVGALILSRITQGTELSNEFLESYK